MPCGTRGTFLHDAAPPVEVLDGALVTGAEDLEPLGASEDQGRRLTAGCAYGLTSGGAAIVRPELPRRQGALRVHFKTGFNTRLGPVPALL